MIQYDQDGNDPGVSAKPLGDHLTALERSVDRYTARSAGSGRVLAASPEEAKARAVAEPIPDVRYSLDRYARAVTFRVRDGSGGRNYSLSFDALMDPAFDSARLAYHLKVQYPNNTFKITTHPDAFGVAASNPVPGVDPRIVQAIADAAATSEMSVNELTRAFGQMSAASLKFADVMRALERAASRWSAEDAETLILEEIRNSNDPFKTGGVWMTRLTGKITDIINQAEAKRADKE